MLFWSVNWGLAMRHLSIAIIAAVSTIALLQIASAADMPVKAPVYKAPIAIAPTWTGFYIGANIGGGWSNRNVDYVANDPAAVLLFSIGGQPPSTSFKTSGALGGLQVGYNWQFNPKWLVGLETDFNWSGMKGSGSVAGVLGGAIPFTESVDERIKWFGTVRARLGYVPTDNLLTYITGGFAYGRVEHAGSYINNSAILAIAVVPVGGFSWACSGASTCFAGSSSGVVPGWTVGGGVEYAFWHKWTFKVEYLYVSLEGKSVAETALAFAPGSAPSSFNANYSRTNFNIARVGVNYRF
jgi:outer membrane immunogenic protein